MRLLDGMFAWRNHQVLFGCRRWVINHMISGGVQQTTIDSVLKADSKLVELIAGVCHSISCTLFFRY
jgi:hypothetical protein